MEDRDLFAEFPPVSTEEWEEKIQADLKGADYEKKLVWKTSEGFKVKPYYRKEDLVKIDFTSLNPAEFPYVRGTKKKANDWEIREDIFVDTIEEANKKALNALNKGATAIAFIFDMPTEDVKKLIPNQENFSALLRDIFFEGIEVSLVARDGNLNLLHYFIHEALHKKVDLKAISGAFDYDPLGDLTLTGKFIPAIEEIKENLKKTIQTGMGKIPGYRVIGVNAKYFANAGATLTGELAFALCMGNEYLSLLTDQGVKVDDIAKRIQFNFAVGSNYFLEIAKFRAARLLWASIVEAYKPGEEHSEKMYIHAVNADWNKTIYDPYVNMLRSTTETMSAALGGVNSITVKPFDAIFRVTSPFSERIARNTQIVLKEEAYFDKIVDPAAGSYYIETLTKEIAENAWKLFLEIEKAGGYIEAFKKGIIQDHVKASMSLKLQALAIRKEILVGTNQYPNYEETVKKQIVPEMIDYPEPGSDKTMARPLGRIRMAREFESLRLRAEKHRDGRPKVFLLTYGNLSMRRARAQFSGNFFACAGYAIKDNNGFTSIEEGIKSSKEWKADITVLCSADEEYPEIAPKALELLKNKAILVVAGAPPSMEELKSKSVEHFIHVRSNVLETLEKFHGLLGIK